MVPEYVQHLIAPAQYIPVGTPSKDREIMLEILLPDISVILRTYRIESRFHVLRVRSPIGEQIHDGDPGITPQFSEPDAFTDGVIIHVGICSGRVEHDEEYSIPGSPSPGKKVPVLTAL
jgi:hypothetical protein